MFWGYIFILVGVGWILQYYGVIPKDLEFFWPVIFIAIGLSILFGKSISRCWDVRREEKPKE